jgi:putative FmdB family regulatory protein
MPTYDYKCPKCGTAFERSQKMSDPPKAKCPKCGGKAERQLSGGHGIVFKGSGFYETDYKRAGEKKGKKEGGKDAGTSSGPAPTTGSSGPSSTSGSKD